MLRLPIDGKFWMCRWLLRRINPVAAVLRSNRFTQEKFAMIDHQNPIGSRLQAEFDLLNDMGGSDGDSVFMRMLRELRANQFEIEKHDIALREARFELEKIRDRYEHLYDYSRQAYFTFDPCGVVLKTNLAGAAMLCMDRDGLIGMSFANFVSIQDRPIFQQYIKDEISGAALAETEVSLDLQNDRKITLRMNVAPELESTEGQECCRIAFTDVTEHKLISLKLDMANRGLDNTREGIMLTDANNTIISVNSALTSTCGYSAEELIGHTPSILKSGHHDDEFYQTMYAEFNANNHWHGEIWNRHKDGEIYPEWLNINVIRTASGEVESYIGIFTDIGNQEEMKNRLYQLAYYDELTGLPNRSLLYDRLNHQLMQSKRSGSKMAVLFIDLDRFKVINDTHGHEIGDHILQLASERLLSCIRDGDTLARLGGDEFVAVLKDVENEEVAAQVAERMVNSMIPAFVSHDCEMFMTTSVGISLSPMDGDEVSELLRNADSAMYYAKLQGRNNYKYYKPQLTRVGNRHS